MSRFVCAAMVHKTVTNVHNEQNGDWIVKARHIKGIISGQRISNCSGFKWTSVRVEMKIRRMAIIMWNQSYFLFNFIESTHSRSFDGMMMAHRHIHTNEFLDNFNWLNSQTFHRKAKTYQQNCSFISYYVIITVNVCDEQNIHRKKKSYVIILEDNGI